jgi:Nucleotide-diphospho-sugar transferase
VGQPKIEQSVCPCLYIYPEGFEWGSENWSKASWSRTAIISFVISLGFNVVWSDIDVVWFKVGVQT